MKDVKILVIDDDDIDRRAIRQAFKKEKIFNPIVEATSGEAGLNILRGTNGSEKLEAPFMILLDINMPGMSGHDFLKTIREDPQLSGSIVFMLTTSNADKDRFRAYENHCSGYLLKECIAESFLNAIKMLDLFMVSVKFP